MRQTFSNIIRRLQKRTPVEGLGNRGFAYVDDGHEVGEVEVIVDLAGIAKELGRNAMANKTGKSKYLKGLVEVRVISKRRLEQQAQ